VSEGVAYAVVVRRIAIRREARSTFFKGGHFFMQVSCVVLFFMIWRAYMRAMRNVKKHWRRQIIKTSQKDISIKGNDLG
jgi:hypothetical protein